LAREEYKLVEKDDKQVERVPGDDGGWRAGKFAIGANISLSTQLIHHPSIWE
jgi:hypothetical protein